MSQRYAYCTDDGRIVSILDGDDHVQMPNATGEMLRAPCPDGVTPVSHYFDGQDFVPIPERTGDFSTFNYVSRTWETDMNAAANAVRRKRDSLLAETDWTQLPDVPEATRTMWQAYRQALRDLPQQPGFPTNVTWPEAPV